MTVNLCTLAPGTPFEIPGTGRTGTVVHVYTGSVSVDYDAVRVKKFRDERRDRDVEFRSKHERATISRTTQVNSLI
jgi:hypothetical protein